MFWRMTGLSTTSPIDAILDKDNYTLEELLDEDEIIQECKALNSRLINFLREKTQVEQLVRYIVEESPEHVEKSRTFKYPFIACEIFTCEVDVILKALIEEEELMDILFAFLQPERSHSTLLSGYFSKVVICLMLRKTLPFMTYVQAHKEIIHQLVDLIGITSIMEVLVRLVGADDHIYTNYIDTMQWLNDSDVLEMIVDKFSSSESPEVHANTAETFCAILRYTPSTLASKIASPSFVGRLISHALDGSRPKSVLVHSLTVCIALLDPKRAFSTPAYLSRGQLSYGSTTIASTETVEGMLEKLGDLLQLLDVSSSQLTWVTTYGKLQPPLGKHRLKIVEFISVLLSTGAEVAEKELVHLGAFKQILDLFFEYPFNNFLHHHVEDMILSCLEFRKNVLTEHLFQDCNLVGRILAAERSPTLSPDSDKPTSASGRLPPKIGNIGHLTRIENKLVQLANSNSQILTYLQENSDWTSWQTDVLTKRNAMENVYNWTCGRPTTLHERTRDSDDDDFRDRDYDVAALASNLSQAFRYGIYGNDDIEEAHGTLERDDEDVYFDDESAEVVISSLRLGDEQESGSIFTNSNWFTFGDDRDGSNNLASVSPSAEDDAALVAEDSESQDTSRSPLEPEESGLQSAEVLNDTIREEVNDHQPVDSAEGEKPPEWVEWRESSDSGTPEPNSEAQDNNNAEPDQEPLMSGVSAPPLHPDPPAVEETGGKSTDPFLLVFEDVDLSSEEGPSGAINHDAHEGVEGADAKDVVDDVVAAATAN